MSEQQWSVDSVLIGMMDKRAMEKPEREGKDKRRGREDGICLFVCLFVYLYL